MTGSLPGGCSMTGGVSLARTVSSVTGPALDTGATLDLNFLAQAGALDTRITFTRATTATYYNAAGALTTASSGAARFDYDPATLLPRGLLIEEARTNKATNGNATGSVNGVFGSGGDLPTGWSYYNPDNLTYTILGSGSDSGRSYFEIRFNGTGGGGGTAQINLAASIAASNTQTWTGGIEVKRTAGSVANLTSALQINAYNAGNGFLVAYTGSDFSITSSWQRFTLTKTLADASTGNTQPILILNYANGAAIDVTLRIGCTQMELAAFPTSYIPTSGAEATRNAEVLTCAATAAATGAMVATAIQEVIGTANQLYAQLDDGSASNRFLVFGTATTGAPGATSTAGGSATSIAPAGTIAALGISGIGLAWTAGATTALWNRGAASTGAPADLPSGITTLRFGATSAPAGFLNGWLRRVRVYASGLSAANLKALT